MVFVGRKNKKEVRKPVFINRTERVHARNRVLIARYYYWTEMQRRRFDDVMCILSEDEFFVDERTITNTLNAYSEYLNELYQSSNVKRILKKEYPSWNWD